MTPGVILAVLISPFKEALVELRASLRPDRTILCFTAAYVLLFAPLLPLSIDTWHRTKQSGRKDELALTAHLESMTVAPYGNSANYWNHPEKRPEFWKYCSFNYHVYAQGIYFDLAFLVFFPLKCLGFHTFPTGPFILRSISFVAGLLSMFLLYNFGKRYSGKLCALFSVFVWMTSFWFCQMAPSVHPDSLQFALSFLALHLAVRHQRDGKLVSLAVLGLVCGLQHTAKAGGPWHAPMVLLALWWGWRSQEAGASSRRPLALVGRFLFLVSCGAAGFFLGSPYTLVDRAYWRVMLHAQANLHLVTFRDWMVGIWQDQGGLFVVLALAGLAYQFLRLCTRTVNRALCLAAVLAIGNLAWFSLLGRAEMRIDWVAVSFPLLALVIGDLLSAVISWLHERSPHATRLGYAAVGLLFAVLLYDRWYGMVRTVAGRAFAQDSTPFLTESARSIMPPDSAILGDLSAYVPFDTDVYPRQMNTGTLRYCDLWKHEPDYFLLTKDLYENSMYVNIMRSQQKSIFSTDTWNLRLYQDLILKSDYPKRVGKTRVPGIEVVGVITTPPYPCFAEPSNAFFQSVKAIFPRFSREFVSACNLAAGKLIEPTHYVQYDQHIVFKRHAPGTHLGSPGPISGGSANGANAALAFDESPGPWKSCQRGSDVDGNAYIGFDFGCGNAQSIRSMDITWAAPRFTPKECKLQASEDGRAWVDVQMVSPMVSTNAKKRTTRETVTLDDGTPAHRMWRLVAAAPLPEDVPFAVTEIRFEMAGPEGYFSPLFTAGQVQAVDQN